MAVSKKDRRLVYDRDGNMCANCGIDETLTIQHRANRGFGGDPSKERLSNYMVLCYWCNGRLESNADFAAIGIDKGWKLRSWEDPLKVCVFYAFDGWYYLTDDGRRVKR